MFKFSLFMDDNNSPYDIGDDGATPSLPRPGDQNGNNNNPGTKPKGKHFGSDPIDKPIIFNPFLQ